MPELFIPTNPCFGEILTHCNHQDSADIVFDVDEPGGGIQRFYAHRMILRMSAPSLAEYCDGVAASSSVADSLLVVPVSNVRHAVFHHLLYYVYGGIIAAEILKELSREIIEFADRFGLGHLKVLAEGYYVESTKINVGNFFELYHFSDTKKCALLKETVMNFILDNVTQVMQLFHGVDGSQSESMITDLLTALAKRAGLDGFFKTMSVVNLRKKLDERGLDVDGTHEMLVDSLERSYPCFIVEGAGSACVNGRYIAAKELYSKMVYKSMSNDEGVYVLLIKDTNSWYISIVDPHQKTDKILYQVHSKESQGPPSNGWTTETKHGAVDPPPTVITKFPW
jgi:hypothetical protein